MKSHCTQNTDRECREEDCCLNRFKNKTESTRSEKLSLLIGTIIGQISEMLNQVSTKQHDLNHFYNSLLDIHKMASLQIHELYYKDKP